MKALSIASLVAAHVATLIVAAATVGLAAGSPQVSPAPSRFALVELFTSEGCSSCPPADALLARLATDATRTGDPVAALSFHVTYWNHLGWVDRFSDDAFTRRQTAYAKRLALASLYTPQMLVDGEREFVGSDAAAAKDAVQSALARERRTRVTLAARADHRNVTVTSHVAGAPDGAVLWVAWADAHDASAPDGGENQGSQLHHANVVRTLERVALHGANYSGTIHLRRPEEVPGRVIAWVQLGDVGPVSGGAVAPLGDDSRGR